MATVTPNAIETVLKGGEGVTHTDFNPVLQVLDVKKVQAPGGGLRFRILLTDKSKSIPAMVATQNNELLVEGKVTTNTLIRLSEFTYNNLGGTPIFILLAFTIVGMGQTPAAAPAEPTAPAPMSVSSTPPPHMHSGGAYAPAIPVASGSSYGGYGAAANSRPVVREEADPNVMPISSLNPYTNRWTIKARITNKSEIRRYSNAKGEGTLCNIELLDAHGGEIRGTFFKDAVDKWYSALEVGKVYTFSGGQLKVADRKYNTLKSDYEITFNIHSEIKPVLGEESSIKARQYHFVKLHELASAAVNSNVDVLVAVKAAGDISEIVSQKMGGKVMKKRELTVFDDSGCECRLTLWGDMATKETNWLDHLYAFKSLRVGEYNGKNLSMGNNSAFEEDPDVEGARDLFKYKNETNLATGLTSLSTGGGSGSVDSFDKRREVAAIKDEGLGLSEKPDYASIKATVNYIKHDNDCWYTACPTEGCNKKVTETMGNRYHCEKCNKEFPQCQRRYILSVTMTDQSGQSWFSMFNDTAQVLLGRTADELNEMKGSGDDAGYEAVFKSALFKTFICRARIKQEAVNDEMRVKSTVVTVQPINYVQESRNLLEAISKYN